MKRPAELDDPDRREVSADGYTRGPISFPNDGDWSGLVFRIVPIECKHHPRYKCPHCDPDFFTLRIEPFDLSGD